MSESFTSKQYLIRNSSVTSLFRGLGVGTGIILDAIILYYFGLSKETDAFFAALSIPMMVTGILESQVPNVLIPVFKETIEKNGKHTSWELLSNTLTLSTILLSGLSLLGMVSTIGLMPIQIPGLNKETVSLSINLSLILYWLLPIRGICAILSSISFVYHRYLLPSSTRFINNCSTILIILFLREGIGIYAVAIGFIIGGVSQIFLLIMGMRANGFTYRFMCKGRDSKLRQMLKLLVYPMLGDLLGGSKVLIENFLASFLGTGSISVLRYASRIVEAISGVLLGGVVTPMLPLVSHYVSRNDLDRMKETLLNGAKILIFISLPICIWLIMMAKPLLILFFARGQFSIEDTKTVSVIISLLVPYILFSRVISIMQTPFYATIDMRTPFFAGLWFLVTYAIVAFSLLKIAGIYSFPVASSAAALISSCFMMAIFRVRFGVLGWGKLLDRFSLRFLGTIFIMTIFLVVGRKIVEDFSIYAFIDKFLYFAIPTALGGASFVLCVLLFNVVKIDDLSAVVRRVGKLSN